MHKLREMNSFSTLHVKISGCKVFGSQTSIVWRVNPRKLCQLFSRGPRRGRRKFVDFPIVFGKMRKYAFKFHYFQRVCSTYQRKIKIVYPDMSISTKRAEYFTTLRRKKNLKIIWLRLFQVYFRPCRAQRLGSKKLFSVAPLAIFKVIASNLAGSVFTQNHDGSSHVKFRCLTATCFTDSVCYTMRRVFSVRHQFCFNPEITFAQKT